MGSPTTAPEKTEGSVTEAAGTPAIDIQNLTKWFKTSFKRQPLCAVQDVSLRIEAGEVYGLIGPNGSGKSTTMKILLGLVRATSGSSAIFGRPSEEVASRSQVGFLPENPYFYKYLTGGETLKFFGKLCGLDKATIEERTEMLLDLVDLQEARHRRLSGYSKGMLQRIGLAQAMIHEPRLVVLDEPTAGVDPVGSRQIRDLVFRLKEKGITVFLCSHLLEQVQEVCDRVGIIYQGKMVREGTLEELISIEDQTELILRGEDEALMEKLRAEVGKSEKVELVSEGRPRTTLERLFLKATGHEDDAESSRGGGK